MVKKPEIKTKLDSFLYANVIGWAFLLTINTFFYIILSLGGEWLFEINFYLKGVFLNIYFLVTFFIFRYRAEKYKRKPTNELLRSVFYVASICVFVSVLLQLAFVFFNKSIFTNSVSVVNTFYTINIFLIGIFFHYTLFVFKVLIFREAPKRIGTIWSIFIYIFIASLIFNFFSFSLSDPPATITFGAIILIAIILSVNMRWVAYLSAREKIESIILLIFILLYGGYFLFIVERYYLKGVVLIDLATSIYALSIMSFVILYAFMSILVVIFNIPTTSVFEKKLNDIITFQELTQTLQIGNSEEDIYKALMQNAIKVTSAEAGWLEILDKQGKSAVFLHEGIDREQVHEIRGLLRKKRLQKIVDVTFSREIERQSLENQMNGFESILAKTLVARDTKIGSIVLLKEQVDGFTDEQKNLVEAFTKQTSIALENYRLVEEIIIGERYKQELAIAQKVQQSLLPKNLNISQYFDLTAFSYSAQQVGGDYYDVYKMNDYQTYIVIGDVSGKGTSAAFNMAQMKGIFQSLVLLHLPPQDFLTYANEAIIQCFDKSSFITITLIEINTKMQQVAICRAGHCPTLYFDSRQARTYYIKDKGLGLGVLRNKAYGKFIETKVINYEPSDLFILYTDGITEARNTKGEEYGPERLQHLVSEHQQQGVEIIRQKIEQNLNDFVGEQPPHDDYTAVILRLK